MTRDVHRQALTAAARIACAAALVGCAKNQAPEPSADADAPLDFARPDAGALTLSNPERAACEQTIDEGLDFGLTMPEADAAQSEWEAYYAAHQEKVAIAKGDAELASCCNKIAAAFGDDLDAAMTWEHRGACCEIVDWRGSLACTPWGPPTPPSVPGEA